MKHVGLLLMLLLCLDLYSQNYVKGVVSSADDKKCLPNAVVTIYDSTGIKILTYGFTSDNGRFDIELNDHIIKQKQLYMEISFMGFVKKRIAIETKSGKEHRIELDPTNFVLNEIKIKAPKVSMKGDTLNYTVGQFMQSQDRNIGEVLKRIPGVEVDELGQIKYNDVPINSFYIDGKNLLGNQYGIATRNIRPSLITMIQVFEKHQPIKALENRAFSESAAINLTIAAQNRSKLIGAADLGLGAAPLLWNSRLTLFSFGEKNQLMTVIKSNNNGEEVASELNLMNMGADFALQNPDLKSREMLNLSEPISATFSGQRWLLNLSNMASANYLFNISKDVQATLKVNYIQETIENNSKQVTRFLIDGVNDITIIEESESERMEKTPSIDFTITSNKKNFYFQNRIYGRAAFMDKEGVIFGTRHVNQTLGQDKFNLAEIISIVKPLGKTLFRFNSKTQLYSLPEFLNISTDSINQKSALFRVKSENTLSTQLRLKKVIPTISTGYNFSIQNVDSQLEDHRKYPIFSGANQIGLSESEFFFTPSARYEINRWKYLISIPARFYIYNFNNNYNRLENFNNSFFKFQPFATITYQATRDFEVVAAYSFGSNMNVEVQNMTPNMVLNNYRQVTLGFKSMPDLDFSNVRLNLKYSNPLKLIFIGAGITYSKNIGGVKYSVDYEDYLTINTLLYDEKLVNSSLVFSGRVSKSFFDSPLSLRLAVNHRISGAEYLQLGRPVSITSKVWNFEPSASYSIKDLFDAQVFIRGARLKRISSTNYETSVIRANTSLMTSFILTPKIKISGQIDHFYNKSAGSETGSSFFADIKLSYKTDRGNVEFLINNMLNNNEYTHISFNELTKSETQIFIRPRHFMILYTLQI